MNIRAIFFLIILLILKKKSYIYTIMRKKIDNTYSLIIRRLIIHIMEKNFKHSLITIGQVSYCKKCLVEPHNRESFVSIMIRVNPLLV